MGEIQLPKNNLRLRGKLLESPKNQYKARAGSKTNNAVMMSGNLKGCSIG